MTADIANAEMHRRFLTATVKLTGLSAESPITRLGLAVSGGPDSMALLLLAHAVFPGKIAAATVDHGLRAEAASEAEYVARFCEERAIPHRTLRPENPITGNIQSAARKARYGLLNQWARECGCQWVATAHHADDQLETILMRLVRGSGIDGLSGIRPVNGNIIRPLLQFTKAELIALCRSEGVGTITDPSNDNADYDRVRMRQWLASAPHPLKSAAAANSAAALADAAAAIEWMTETVKKDRMTITGDAVQIDPTGLPREMVRRLIVAALAILSPDFKPRGPALSLIHESLLTGQKAAIGNMVCTGGKIWHFCHAPPRQNG